MKPTDEDLTELASQGVARVLVTHRNHSCAANKIRALSVGAVGDGVPILQSAKERLRELVQTF